MSTTAVIDPVLLHQAVLPWADNGTLIPKGEYEARLKGVKRKEPLQSVCKDFNVRVAKKANLEKLRAALINHWYSANEQQGSSTNAEITAPIHEVAPPACDSTRPSHSSHPHTQDTESDDEEDIRNMERRAAEGSQRAEEAIAAAKCHMYEVTEPVEDICPEDLDFDVDDGALVEQYDVRQHLAEATFGVFDAGVEEEDLEELDYDDDETFKRFQKNIRLAAAQRTESNRRTGGKKTQVAVAKCWNLKEQSIQLASLTAKLDRRTSHWTPPKAFLADADGNPTTSVARRLEFISDTQNIQHIFSSSSSLAPPAHINSEARIQEDSGIYMAADNTLRGYIVPSPTVSSTPRPRTGVDLVLPPSIAFCNPGEDLIHHPFLGQHSAEWPLIFEAVKQPQTLWEAWKPSKTLDQMSVQEVWDCYEHGEKVFDNEGRPTGKKPPLRQVEKHFQSSWRKTAAQRKAWQRFREIPEWIEQSGHSPKAAITRLEARRKVPGKLFNLGTNALVGVLKEERKQATQNFVNIIMPPPSSSSPPSSPSAVPPCSSPSSMDNLLANASKPKRRAPAIGARPRPKKFKSV